MQQKKWFRLVSVLMGLQVFFSSALPASAFFGSPSIPSASESAADIERRYHIDTGSVQDQGESLNVADSKKVTPEVSLFFSPSDPTEGEKITARSFATYFSNDASKLYFTWYLMRAECAPGNPVTPQCDLDGSGVLNHNDWKIMAHRILASNDVDLANVNYGADTDADGYSARFGGDNRVNVPNHCYFHDNTSGENYELASGSGSVSFICPTPGKTPVCMVQSANVDPGTINLSAGGSATASGSTFVFTGGEYYVSALPYCSVFNVSACSVGTPCCVSNPATANSCEEELRDCDPTAGGAPNPICRHLFPDAPGFTSGDGVFGANEERFWQTDSNDPDTAGNGNKDEANVVGLGRDSFTWNYLRGDKVGVVIEGTSMIPTKHQDSSNGIMWAFSKNKCKPAGGTGSYALNVKGYQVVIPTIDMDLNDCLFDNLVDPTEGGQATNLELSLTASPSDPMNDVGTRGDGDILEVVATVDNAAQEIQNVYYDWRVELSPDGTANPAGPWINVTAALNSLAGGRKLLSPVRGNGVNRVRLSMNIRGTDVLGINPFSTYLRNDIGYLRFRVEGVENFNASGASRRGRSSTIVKFNASQDRIVAHTVTVAGDPAHVSLNAANEICSGAFNATDPAEQQALSRLDSKLCRVIRNEIIGIEIPLDPSLSNYNWTINGQPLICNAKVSVQCSDDRQGNINFFPVVGNIGDTYNIALTANRIDVGTSTEKTVTLSRTFKIVQPAVSIISNDQNNVWPKVLGQFVDTTGNAYTEFSKDTLETYAENNVPVRAIFTPDFLSSEAPPKVERSWTVDGSVVGDPSSNVISFPAAKIGKSVYNVSIQAVYRPSTLVRQAMEDIWGLSTLDTTEIYFSNNTQVEQPDTTNLTYTGAKKYYALIASYLPGPVLFALKVLFSVFLILFASGVVFALIPNVPEPAPSRNRQRE
ncbi:MAG: hypothetical protein WAT81_03390 [Candidatus Moraniibacteriota bacterium]